MGKTDHKKMWKKMRKENAFLFNEVQRWKDIAEEQGNIIRDIRDGKIDVAEIIMPVRKVKPDKKLLKILEQGKKRAEEIKEEDEAKN